MTVAPARPASGPATLPEIPFPGLNWFTAEYAPFFFGRDGDRKVIISNVEASRLTLLYGASGVGKSSVLLAGVVRSLRARALEDIARRHRRREAAGRADEPDVAKFAITEFRRWVDDPLPHLMEHVRLSAMEALGGEELTPWHPGDDPVERLREWTTRVRFLYLVLDQFEEYFLYHAPSNEPGSFDVELARLVNEPGLHVNVILSLREDALALLDRFKPTVPRLYDNYLRIDHLDLKAAEQAIRGPVEAYNTYHDTELSVDDALVRRLLGSPELRAHRALGADASVVLASDDTATPRLETAYLQLVMRRLWETERARGSSSLRLETLDELGGPRQIVKGHLDDAMAALSQDEQEIAVEVFHHLVTPSKSKVAHAAADLADYVKLTESQVTPVLDKLCAGNRILRRIVAPADPAADGAERARYEIFHDVLAEPILAWRAQKLAQRAEDEERSAKERELQEQVAEEQEKRRIAQARARRIGFTAVGVLVSVVAIAATVVSFVAIKARQTSRSQELAAAALAQAEADPAAALGTALHAMQVKSTPAAANALTMILPRSRLRSIVPSPSWVTAAALGGAHGRYVALGSANGDVRVWDWRAKREVARLHQAGSVTAVQFAQGGKLLFTASTPAQGNIRDMQIWNLSDCVGKTPCDNVQYWTGGGVNTAAISADGRWLVDDWSKGAELWNVAQCRTTSCHATPLTAASEVRGLAVQGVSNGALVAVTEAGGDVVVWSRTNGRYHIVRRLPTPWADPQGVAISPDTKRLAAFGDRGVLVWDLTHCTTSTLCDVVLRARAADWMQALAFSPDGESIATASEDGVARIWNLLQPTPPLELHGLNGIVFSLGFSADGRYLVSGGNDGEGRIWKIDRGAVVARASTWSVTAAFDPAGDRIATSTFTGDVAVRDRAGHVLRTLRMPVKSNPRLGAVYVAYADDGKHVYGLSAAGASAVWNPDACRRGAPCTGKRLAPPSGSAAIAMSRDGALVAIADDDAYDVSLTATRTGRVVGKLTTSGQPMSLAFSPGAPWLAMAAADGTITIWNVSGCTAAHRCHPPVVQTIVAPTILMGLAFSPDGSRLAAGAGDGIGRIWDLEKTFSTPLELVGHTSNIRTIAFSADGSRVVTGGADTSIRIWDARTGNPLAILPNHADRIETVMFDPRDSSKVLSASDDGTVRISTCDICGSRADVIALASKLRAQVTAPAKWLPTDPGRPHGA